MVLTKIMPSKRQKKSGQSQAAERVTGSGVVPEKRTKLRENERLRSVLKESTLGAALETLGKNLRFRLVPDSEGNPRWLALLLRADAIGGLSEKTKRDEAKGSLVQQIVSDQIEAVATEEMLDREFFAIVPSQGTLDRMSEYSMLTSAQYHWIVFSMVNGALVFDENIGPAAYAEAVAIQDGGSMQQVITQARPNGAETWSRIEAGAGAGVGSGAVEFARADVLHTPSRSGRGASSESNVVPSNDHDEIFGADAVSQAAQAQILPDAGADLIDGEGFYEGLDESEGYDELASLDNDERSGDVDAEGVEGVDSTNDGISEPQSAYDVPESGTLTPYAAYVESTKDSVFTEAEVQASIARRFLSEDLDLTVDMREFELAFAAGSAPTVNVSSSIPEESTDWLGRQIAQMADAANSELAALHQRHDSELRQLHIDYTSRHIQEVISDVSVVDSASRFGGMIDTITREREIAVEASHSTVTKRRQEIDQRYSAEADQAAEAAAAQARLTHTRVTRGRREAEIAAVDREVTQDIESRFENERQHVLRLRRADADLGMQRGKTVILEALGVERLRQSDAEDRLLANWNKRILALVDENRKADVARAEALAEQLSRGSAFDDERRQTAERIEELRSEHAERLAELEQRAVRARQEAIDELQRHEAEWQRKLGQAEEKTDASNGVIVQLQRQIKDMSQSYRDQYQDRIASLETSKQVYADELDRTTKAATRVHRVLILLMIVLTVAGLGIGLIGGWALAHAGGSGARGAAGVSLSKTFDAYDEGHMQS